MSINSIFGQYLEEAIGAQKAEVAFSAFSCPASTSVRLNPSKPVASLPADAAIVPWSKYGRLLSERPSFTLDPLFHAGAYYVQDSSSMFVGHVFRDILAKVINNSKAIVDKPIKVLDLCAAPGGKTTDIAASLREVCGDNFVLVANEVMKQRVQVLADNVAIWGDPNVVVTSNDPADFKAMEGWFDIIVADVPCSGEGMFRKDEEACRQWSEDNVKLCASRQKRIIADVWPALADGGVMVYSTCTFNRLENDLNVEWIASELGAGLIYKEGENDFGEAGVIKTDVGYSLVPGFVPGEGQYCSAVVKEGTCGRHDGVFAGKVRGGRPGKVAVQGIPDIKFTVPMTYEVKGETLKAVPEKIAELVKFVAGSLHVVQSGVALGVMKGRNLVPSADLALTIVLGDEAFPKAELSKEDALRFLHKDAVMTPGMPLGLVLVTYCGIPLGFVKNLGNRTNNLHPQSRRIRMDINR